MSVACRRANPAGVVTAVRVTPPLVWSTITTRIAKELAVRKRRQCGEEAPIFVRPSSFEVSQAGQLNECLGTRSSRMAPSGVERICHYNFPQQQGIARVAQRDQPPSWTGVRLQPPHS